MSEEIKLRDETLAKLKSFKNVYDEVIAEQTPFNEFVDVVVSIGLDKMFRDAIPEGFEWSTMEMLFKESPGTVCDLVTKAYSTGRSKTEELKRKARQAFAPYIR